MEPSHENLDMHSQFCVVPIHWMLLVLDLTGMATLRVYRCLFSKDV
jgi:hypothetical protein